MDHLRLADLLAALSLTSDLGTGQLPESAIRSCLVATALARRMGVGEPEVASLYYTTLLQHVGCTAYAHETAALVGGDDIALIAAGGKADDTSLRDTLVFMMTGVARRQPLPARARAIFKVMRAGPSFEHALKRATCEVAVRIADRLGLPDAVQEGLSATHARWDGKGYPPGVAQEDIPPPARFASVAANAILFHDLGGPDLAIETIRRRAGAAFDPAVAGTFIEHGRELLAEFDAADPTVAVLDAEPAPHRTITDARVDEVVRAFADVTDLKSPWLHGHSAGVATLASDAASICGLTVPEVTRVRRAGYLHDLGRVGVPSGIWDKTGPLTVSEWEQVRLHPYHSERILARTAVLADLAPIAGMHHERLDGSGYHRQATALSIPAGARLLAAADVYQAMTQPRPHRPAKSTDEAAAELRADAERGQLDGEAVRAVLEAAGHAPGSARHAWPAGLTDREVEVLRLAAHGRSTREIGDTLSISPKTADHHIQHIYDKIGVSTRAGAALFAMEHDLVNTTGLADEIG